MTTNVVKLREILANSPLHTRLALGDSAATSTPSNSSPTSSDAENNTQRSMDDQSKETEEDLVLNTNFDFQTPAFSSRLLQEAKSSKKSVTEHVLENGERVVMVDPNVSEDEEEVIEELKEEEPSRIDSPDAALRAVASMFSDPSAIPAAPIDRRPLKRVCSPSPKTVGGILNKRRKVEKPMKRSGQELLSSLLAAATAAAAQSSAPPSASKGISPNDSGIVSGEDVLSAITPPVRRRGAGVRTPKTNQIPAAVLQSLINAAGGDSSASSLSDLLTADPMLLKKINEFVSGNPAQQHPLQLMKPSKETPKKADVQMVDDCIDSRTFSTKNETARTRSQISEALNLWQNGGLERIDTPPASSLTNQPNLNGGLVGSDPDLGTVGNEWLLRELFKQQKPPTPNRPGPKRRKSDTSASSHLRSSESVLSQLKSAKGHQRLAELEELEQFAAQFKRQRIKHGFTQGDVGVALGRRYGTDFSQTTISRFEALNLSFKNMCKLRPLMEEWMSEAEAAIARGVTVSEIVEAEGLKKKGEEQVVGFPTVDSILPPPFESSSPGPAPFELVGQSVPFLPQSLMPTTAGGPALALNAVLPTLKKRRKRTNLDNFQRDKLEQYFVANCRPDHQQMSAISNELDLDPDVVRVWFCNKRQKQRKVN